MKKLLIVIRASLSITLFLLATRSSAQLADFVGEYAISPRFILKVAIDSGHLTVSPSGQNPIILKAENDHKFFDTSHPGVTLEFKRDESGKVYSVILSQDGHSMEAGKLSADNQFDPDKKYAPSVLREDLSEFRRTLEKNHPRLYEFTPKQALNHYFDTLYEQINHPMNEIAFRDLLLPVVAMVHCGHTSLHPSIQLEQYHPTSFQPFILYYTGDKAYIRYTSNPALPVGTEVLSVNGEPIKDRIHHLLERVTADGIHPSVQYYLINRPMAWHNFEMPYWFQVSDYTLEILQNGIPKSVHLTTIDESQFKQLIPRALQKQSQLTLLKPQIALLDYPRLDFPSDSLRNEFLEKTFVELKQKKTPNLIIDLRGNGGGDPQNAAYLLRYLMKHDFIYSQSTGIPNLLNLTKPIAVSANNYHGKIWFLIDGGCFSSTGHLLSMIKHYQLGSFVGELSSGSYSCNTDGEPFVLPHTRLTLYCPRGIYETAVSGQKRAEGTKPDYEVKNSFQDIITGRDEILAYAVDHIISK